MEKDKVKFFYFQTTELILIEKIINMFPDLMTNTIKFKTENFYQIINILNPPNTIFHYKNNNKEEKDNYIFSRIRAIFNNNRKVVLQKRIEFRKKNIKKFLEANELVENFLKSKEDFIKENSELQEIKKFSSNSTTKNYVNNNYMIAFTRQVYFLDTTKLSDGSFLTILLDGASLYIPENGTLLTEKEPTSRQLIELFEKFFTPELIARCHLIHCDRCGCNVSKELIQYLDKKKIRISHTNKPCQNQLVEASFCALKKVIKESKFVSLNDNTELKDLIKSVKKEFISLCVNEYNLKKSYKYSRILNGYSRLELDTTKEYFINNVEPENINNKLKMVSYKTKQGKYVQEWNKAILETFENYNKQKELNTKLNLNVNYITENKLKKIKELLFLDNLQEIKNIQKENKKIRTEMDVISKTLSHKVHEHMNNQTEQEKNAIKIVKKKQKNLMAVKMKHAIFFEHWPVISQSIKKQVMNGYKGDKEFLTAKYILLHGILMLTGMRLSDIKYVNLFQLNSFLNKGKMYIKGKMYPYVKNMEPIVKQLIPYLEYMNVCVQKNHKDLYHIDKNHKDLDIRSRSEIWGLASRTSLTRQVNKQLKIARQDLKHPLMWTSHSYRKGLAILAIKTMGIHEAKLLLNHKNISATEAYADQNQNEINIQKMYNTIFTVRNSKIYSLFKSMSLSEEEEASTFLQKLTKKDKAYEYDSGKKKNIMESDIDSDSV